MSGKRWFLGVGGHDSQSEKAKNYIAKCFNQFIFKMNWLGNQVDIVGFRAWLLADEEYEEELAMRTHKVYDHQIKWENIRALLGKENTGVLGTPGR